MKKILLLLTILFTVYQVNAQNSVLQIIKIEELPDKFRILMTTEGLDFSRSRSLFEQKKNIGFNYNDKLLIKVNNKVSVLKSVSFKRGSTGYTETFSNSNFKIIVKCNYVKELPYGIEGWSAFNGNLELYKNNGELLEIVMGYYGEGV